MLGKSSALLLTAALLGACAVSPTGRRQLSLVSEESAIAASKEAYLAQMTELGTAGKLVTDPAIVGRIDRITGRLVAQAVMLRPETAQWEWSVEVIDEPETINAWCMAGGRMAVYTGLINELMPSDDELAQVMGHEISHALANHTAEKMSVAMATQIGIVGAGALAGDNAGAVMGAAALAAQYAIALPNSRTAETEADQIGIELAAKAGYNPSAAVTLWEKMGAAGGEGPPQFMSTHPSPSNRQEKLRELAPQMMEYYQAARNPPSHPIQHSAPPRP
jgi:predicted Zn-dependent protease